MAMLNFSKNDFDKALEELSLVRFSDNTFKLNVYSLELMIYYSTDSTEPFNSLVDSFRHVLSNKKVFSKRKIELNKRFITAIKKLYNLKHTKNPHNDYVIQRLKAEIEAIDYTFAKSWLVKKSDELSYIKRETSNVKRET
jgi:hypothetical protein